MDSIKSSLLCGACAVMGGYHLDHQKERHGCQPEDGADSAVVDEICCTVEAKYAEVRAEMRNIRQMVMIRWYDSTETDSEDISEYKIRTTRNRRQYKKPQSNPRLRYGGGSDDGDDGTVTRRREGNVGADDPRQKAIRIGTGRSLEIWSSKYVNTTD